MQHPACARPEVGDHRRPAFGQGFHARAVLTPVGCIAACAEDAPMTREQFALHIADVSAFARTLGQALNERHPDRPTPPGQVELLNLIARAQGQRNWQALRQVLRQAAAEPAALTEPESPPADDDAPPAPPLSDNARKALAMFDRRGRLMRWPAKYAIQTLVMWVLWTLFDAKRPYTEAEVNAILKSANLFFDHATLRRELINHRLMSRLADCSEYRKLAARPDDEARALLTAWRARRRAG
jgi:hypothetical protein